MKTIDRSWRLWEDVTDVNDSSSDDYVPSDYYYFVNGLMFALEHDYQLLVYQLRFVLKR